MKRVLLGIFLLWPALASANHLYIGLAQYRLKQTSEALISFRAAVECNPKLVAAQLGVGDAYETRGNEGEALAAYLQALNLEPKNAPALRAASNLYLKNGLHTKALPLLETLIEVSPAQVDVRADLGASYAAAGNRKRAEAQFRKALELEPDYSPALAGLGNLLCFGLAIGLAPGGGRSTGVVSK